MGIMFISVCHVLMNFFLDRDMKSATMIGYLAFGRM